MDSIIHVVYKARATTENRHLVLRNWTIHDLQRRHQLCNRAYSWDPRALEVYVSAILACTLNSVVMCCLNAGISLQAQLPCPGHL